MGLVGCRLLYLSVVIVCCWLSGIGCKVLTIDRLVLLSLVVGCQLSGVGCRLSVWAVVHFFYCRYPALAEPPSLMLYRYSVNAIFSYKERRAILALYCIINVPYKLWFISVVGMKEKKKGKKKIKKFKHNFSPCIMFSRECVIDTIVYIKCNWDVV
jgi:hypothetical protein